MNGSDLTKIPEGSHFFNQHYSSFGGLHVNATSIKNLEIQALSISKPRTHFERKFVRLLLSFQLLLGSMKVES